MAVNKFFHDSNKTSISAERDLYKNLVKEAIQIHGCLLYTSPSPRDLAVSRMPSSA